MHRFTIIPLDDGQPPIQIEAIDGAPAIEVAGRLAAAEADILKDDEYLFSVRKLGGGHSFWEIFQRTERPRSEQPSAAPTQQGSALTR